MAMKAYPSYTSGQGVSRTTTNTGGLLVGYRYHFNRWLSGEANYGYDRDTQRYVSTGGLSRVQSDVHAATGDVVVSLPFTMRRFSPYVLGGGGSLVFHPTGNAGGFVSGADTQGKGTFLYGGGVNYTLTKHFSLRAEYRGYVYKAPILAPGASIPIAGLTRRNHPLELFSAFRGTSEQPGNHQSLVFPGCPNGQVKIVVGTTC